MYVDFTELMFYAADYNSRLAFNRFVCLPDALHRQYNNKANRLFHRLAIQALVDSRSFREFKIDKHFYWDFWLYCWTQSWSLGRVRKFEKVWRAHWVMEGVGV
jgi:hypothetical protein